MDRSSNFNNTMKTKKLGFYLILFLVVIVIWKLSVIESDKLHVFKEALDIHKDKLQLTEQQIILLQQLESDRHNKNFPIIYCITPTYSRLVQKAELTRISQTLKLVPNIHWIVVEDADEKSDLVRNLVTDSQLIVTHLVAKTAPFEKLKDKNPKVKRHRGVEQRNTALKWLRDNLVLGRDKGVVYFMDDDNTYSIKLFNEISKVKKVGVWPVGLVGGLNAEAPIVDPVTGKVTGYRSGWLPNRPFAIDMAGFAINLNLILSKKEANFSYQMAKGMQESEFLGYFTTKEELEPLADRCTKVYVWHTRTENPKVTGTIPYLEV
ncbi:galactosylgalactosylxylosylprotein 3-beta-glucuronosyltransferase I isoform X3 [Anthonomus grandis grandis]|uniref:galactosylgalactosylxylosylprotein 3-beta-glucuronosyltransferase I isoform X3 n=1 Tax=Anthonomus grandis grandis TaxID=2921223 RepID=UPI00216573CB|nr:galactosylgalactosylxylosylprotein 3-beta-glucuronosyltransferase I isoform X3 [Anthonomus grandis grandis]